MTESVESSEKDGENRSAGCVDHHPRGGSAGLKRTFGRGAPRFRDALLLSLISSLGPFAANTYVPSFEELSQDLGAPMVAVQQTLSVYLAMFALSSLFVGALSDAVGRRRVIIGGTLIFAIASIAASLCTSLEALMICRMVQGCCAATGPVMTQAVVRDCWDGVAAAKLLGLMAILFGLAPACAPVIGGWITVLAGWRWIFVFLALFNLAVCLSAARFLPETLPPERRQAFQPLKLAAGYRRALSNSAFIAGCVGHGFCFLGGIVYSAGAADFVLDIMGMKENDFGYLVLPLVASTMIGAWCGPRIMTRIGRWKLLAGGIFSLVVIGALAVAIETRVSLAYPLVILLPMAYQFAMSAVRPVMNVMNLDYFPKNRGMAASIQQFCQTAAFCLSSALLVPIVMGAAWKYSAVMLFAGIMTAVLWLIVHAKRDACLPPEMRGR